ncbi:MAG TPA: LuxR C-terminal-related transcriptional regulator, partial [Solirubrobacteraceae bacterium]|nr:LuxR C-terminal-related transcriptional regulator [Solirubrobacteraceae bacterium]
AMALREADDVAAGVARFAGDDRLVADYLRDELLSPLTPAQRAFLMRTSPLKELSGPLCDAVVLQRGSGAVLRDLARSNVLLFALDRSEERFHCNPLLADALRAELRRLEPDREAEIHCRAGEWHEAHGDVEAAIEHALAAGDPARAGQLIWRVVPAYSAYGRNATVERWLSRFTDDELAGHPELALAAATVHMTRGDRDLIELLASNAEASAGTAPDDRREGLDAGVAIMRAAVARDGLAGMRDDAARAYALVPEHSAWRAFCCLLEGTARLFSGDAAGGRERLEEGARRGAMAAPGVQVLCQALLSLRALTEEDWEEGGRLAELARAQVERVQLREYATCAPVYAVSALARAHRGHADQARDDVRDARRLLARLRGFTPVFEGATILALARAELRLSDVMGARTLLAEGERVARGTPDAVVLRAWLDDAWIRADAFVENAVAGPSSLTTAELRVLSFLPTHLPFRQIAAELRVSANTVKTQAHAVYRKLDASSRSEAVARATQLGLLDGG